MMQKRDKSKILVSSSDSQMKKKGLQKKEQKPLVTSLRRGQNEEEYRKLVIELKKQNMELVKSTIELAEAKKKIEDSNIELISLASHEMRTPLTSISSIIQLILEKKIGGINEKQKKSLDIALHDARRLNILIKNMVDVSRVEEGRIVYEFNRFDISDLINKCINTVQLMLKEKNINVKIKDKDSFTVIADKDRIEQVLLNLITNAIKYGKKEGNIWISLAKDKEGVIVSVKDDGVGISENDIPKLFTKEFQAENSEKRVLGGLGYGLYISRKILNKHNGKIWVKSILGKGSTFYVFLPNKQKNLNMKNTTSKKGIQK